MIHEFIKTWDEGGREALRASFAEDPPTSYADIVKRLVGLLAVEGSYDKPDPERITRINDGGYQGTLVFVIGASGYQPSQYWVVKVNYGSCSGCDTFQSIRDDRELPPLDEEGNFTEDPNKPTESQVDRYLVLALHILQRMKEI